MTFVLYVGSLTAIRIKDDVKVLVQLLSEKEGFSGSASITVPLEFGSKLNIGSRFMLEQIHAGGLEEGTPTIP